MLDLKASPDLRGLLPNALTRHQLARHRRQQVVVFIHRLKTIYLEFSLHCEGNHELLAHQSQATLLGGV